MADDDESDLIDVTDLPLDQIRDLPDDVLGAALRRIRDQAKSDSEPVAGFQSAI